MKGHGSEIYGRLNVAYVRSRQIRQYWTESFEAVDSKLVGIGALAIVLNRATCCKPVLNFEDYWIDCPKLKSVLTLNVFIDRRLLL